jgi:large subunit ribosomal protein L17
MRHRVAGRKLNRTSEHRVALRRNLVASLFEHETISTTIEKAKEVKPFAEKLITLAKKGSLQHRRRAIQLLGNRKLVVEENGRKTVAADEPATATAVEETAAVEAEPVATEEAPAEEDTSKSEEPGEEETKDA